MSSETKIEATDKQVQFFKRNLVTKGYDLMPERIGRIKPEYIEEIYVTETCLRVYLKKVPPHAFDTIGKRM